MEISKEEEVECILKDAPLAVVTGAVGVDGVNAKRMRVFMEVLGYIRSFNEMVL